MKLTTRKVTENLTVGQLQNIVATMLQLTGSTDDKELLAKIDSRFNNTTEVKLNAIPLSDWCKDYNYNRSEVFALLRREGILSYDNSLTDYGLEYLQDAEEQSEIAFEELVLFNTNYVNESYTVMVNSVSPQLCNLIEILKPLKGNYKGSKGFTKDKVCKAMQHLCNKYSIV